MRRFRAYVERGVGAQPDEHDIEFPDDATDEQIAEEMDDCVQTLLERVDAGWYEVTNEPLAARGRR